MNGVELIKRIISNLLDRDELVAEIREAGDQYYVSVYNTAGQLAYHYPYIIDKEGNIKGYIGENDNYSDAKIIYSTI